MFKRIFWWALGAVAGWLLWRLISERTEPVHLASDPFPSAPPTQTLSAPAYVSVPADTNSAPVAESAATVPEAGHDSSIEIEGYCMRCKTRRSMANVRLETTESGRRAARGTCPVCAANMYKFLPHE